MDEKLANAHSFPEAPASWNIRYSLDGYDCQITLRGETGREVLTAATAAIDYLKARGATPTAGNGKAHSQPAEQAKAPAMADGTPDPAWCKVHNVEMKRHEKDGQVWYSHKNGDGYCKGK
jgi:hypothetical protein